MKQKNTLIYLFVSKKKPDNWEQCIFTFNVEVVDLQIPLRLIFLKHVHYNLSKIHHHVFREKILEYDQRRREEEKLKPKPKLKLLPINPPPKPERKKYVPSIDLKPKPKKPPVVRKSPSPSPSPIIEKGKFSCRILHSIILIFNI